jgi:ELWxxDGT repeat protein
MDRDDLGPSWLTNVRGTLFFSAYNAATGRELWMSDGTISGTHIVRDINRTG